MKKLCSLGVLLLAFGLFTPTAFADDDLQSPTDVEGVEASAGNESATLTWEMATDNIGVTGYKIYYGLDSVSEDGGTYTFGAMETGDVLEYTVEGLENEVTYYFAMTAVDEAGNESVYYSEEVSATPEGEGEDVDAPYILSASALTEMVVEVVFSEDVNLPLEAASAFSIANLETDEEFSVLDAIVSGEDGSTVLVTTGTQEVDANYMITAGTGITDGAGNPIVSGTSDTAVFEGIAPIVEDEEEEETTEEETTEEDTEEHEASDEEDTESPEIDEVETTTSIEIVVTFDEAVVLPEDAVAAFEVIKADDDSVLEVISVTQDEDDDAVVILETAEQDAGEDYILTVTGITDEAGNELTNTFDRTASFKAITLDVADLIAPEDVTNFVAALMDSVTTSVELAWDASADTAGDLDHYNLYRSDDAEGANYGDATELAKEDTSYEATGLTEGETYTFKLTSVDESGNESLGMISVITLPETGAGLGAVLIATALGTGIVGRRRKN